MLRLDMNKIIVVNLGGMGDLVLSSPALKSLRITFPQAYMATLVFCENKDLLTKCPYINEVFFLKKRATIRNIFDNLFIIFKMHRLKFNMAINLQQHYTIFGALKMWFLFFLINSKKTLGRNTDKKGFFYDFKIEDSLKSEKHQVTRLVDAVNFLGANKIEPELEVWFSEEAERHLRLFLEKHKLFNSDFIIGINPGSHRPSHRWPRENFAALSQELIKRKGVKIVLTGSKEERRLAEDIAYKVGLPVIISCGEFNLEELIVFIKRCNLFITNDTGPMHIANALKKPLIVLSGGGPEDTLPFHKENCIVVRKEVSCRPCYKFYCKQPHCLQAISPEEIIAAVQTFI